LPNIGANETFFQEPIALREAVTRLAAEPARRARLGRRARESVAVRSWNALGDELLGHYRAAIDSVRSVQGEAVA
jgi:hypothetical protein